MDLESWKKLDKSGLKLDEIRSFAPCFGLREWKPLSKEDLLDEIEKKIENLPEIDGKINFRKKTKAELVELGLVLGLRFDDLKKTRDELKAIILKKTTEGEINVKGVTNYPVIRYEHQFDPSRHNGYSIGDLRNFVGEYEKK